MDIETIDERSVKNSLRNLKILIYTVKSSTIAIRIIIFAHLLEYVKDKENCKIHLTSL